jgi:peptidoglycan/LPS O-acetylase OafA/YrhL
MRGEICPGGSAFLTVYWSLALEEQFYLVLPLALFLIPRKWIVPVLLLLVVCQFFIPRPQAPLNAFWYWRTDALMLGGLIAIWRANFASWLVEPHFLENRIVRYMTLALLFILLATLPRTNLPIATGLVAVVSATLVLIASFDNDYMMKPGFGMALMTWIGTRSYAIYLIHVPAFAVTRLIWSHAKGPAFRLNSFYAVPFLLSALLIIAVLAEFNFRCVEQPLRRRGKQIASRFADAPSGASAT